MKKKVEEIKRFSVNLPFEMWHFLKRYAMDNETGMNEVIRDQLEIFMKKNSGK
jgi:hypothetical protein